MHSLLIFSFCIQLFIDTQTIFVVLEYPINKCIKFPIPTYVVLLLEDSASTRLFIRSSKKSTCNWIQNS